MTAARSTQIDLTMTAFYHCMTRCVRQSYLCGVDTETGKDYTHRKHWIVARIKKLAKIFAIQICAYAVMSNHYHLVLFVDDSLASQWQDAKVKALWQKLFPQDVNKLETSGLSAIEIKRKIDEWRQRLTSISWFMRCLNEPIARFSNKEDECVGRFWAGRFKCQALLDEGALLSAMAYVDLNPIRANIATTPETSNFTSIQERIFYMAEQRSHSRKDKISITHCDVLKQPENLMSFNNGAKQKKQTFKQIDFKLSDYLQLVDNTGRYIRSDKRGAIPKNLAPILKRLNLSSNGWLLIATQLEAHFYAALGHEILLSNLGVKLQQRSPKGIQVARKCYLNSAA